MLNFESMHNQSRKVLLLGILLFLWNHTITIDLVVYKNRNLLSHISGGQKLEVSITWPESRWQQGLFTPEERIGSLTFPASSDCWLSLTCGLVTPISAYVVTLAPPLQSVSNLPQSLLQGYLRLIALRPTWRIQDTLPISRSLTYTCKDPFPK